MAKGISCLPVGYNVSTDNLGDYTVPDLYGVGDFLFFLTGCGVLAPNPDITVDSPCLHPPAPT